MQVYGYWNNKGGTGKTSLCFQSLTEYAHRYPDKRVLAIDVCPQANLSELLFGGLTNKGSDVLLARQAEPVRRTIGGYFEFRLPNPYMSPAITADAYISRPSDYNENIPKNVDLIAGDPLLELQSNAISTLANANLPGTNAWLGVIDWIKDLLAAIDDKYDVVFVDANPSFSMYTQIALACADRLVVPVMADDSSRRAIQNAFSLIYGLKLPSAIYSTYAFATRLKEAGRDLPKVHIIAKNRLTQYMGPASAYSAVLHSIDTDVKSLLASNPEIFTAADCDDTIVHIRDFQTAGVVAHARGCPFYLQRPGRMDVGGKRVQVKRDYVDDCVESIDELVSKL
ncbi:ParA family protein [Mycobacterium avium]|uniref:ParA family protein n=1 Tax=Mycobacterium avium TaxID=1764 RepID=UPI001CC4B2E5|nr:ParA family protein [Mycobacterium avium]MBZ4534095.1 ParA family protein [Mycobacterium avium subsp. hominissuis]MBZ4592863.1 ParA family protein [Mycobacterium avium subsp. hominissuis]MBZ4634609.1 ParA family protein [Mycobacterium avium subsp. hominissuis]